MIVPTTLAITTGRMRSISLVTVKSAVLDDMVDAELPVLTEDMARTPSPTSTFHDCLPEQVRVHMLQRLGNAPGRELHLLEYVSADINSLRYLGQDEPVPLDRKHRTLGDQGRFLTAFGYALCYRISNLLDRFHQFA